MDTARVNGREIAFEDSGGDGPVVLFSHGLLMNRTMFDPQVAALREDHRCVAWDQRGHGGTPVDGPFTYWDSADDALALLDHLGVDDAVLVGMSQGGFVSLRAALRAPSRVRALVLIDTQAGVEDPDAVPLYEAMRDQWLAEGPAGVQDAVAAIIFGDGVDPAPWFATWAAWPAEHLTLPLRTLVERDDLEDRLGEIAAPALVIHGERDAAIPVDRARRLATGLPGARPLVLVPGAGHAANLSHPDEVNAAVASFLGELA